MRYIACAIFFLALTACSSTPESSQEELVSAATFESREQMLTSSGNSKALIELYKGELIREYSEALKLKLVKAYMREGDFESASFHLQEIEVDDSNVSTVSFLKAKVYLALGDIESAYQRIQTALVGKESFPEAENLMGLILAEKKELQKAREYFYLAKRHYHDDLTITNNLAVLDLLEGNYTYVVDRLQPLYLKGEADKTIQANLILANVKLGRYHQAETILKEQGYKEDQIHSIFVVLSKATSSVSQEVEPDKLDIPVDTSTRKKVKVIKESGFEGEN